MSYIPIEVYKIMGQGNGAQPVTRRLLEAAGETFNMGTPVVVYTTSGYLIASPTLSSALTIAGFSQEPAQNLTNAGVPQTLTYGKVQNQPSAVLIPGGAPPSDGRCGVWLANDSTIFIGVVKSTQTPAITDVGVIYGMTKDGTSGFWYIDKDITAANSGAIFEIVEIPVIPGDPLAPATPVAGGKVAFKVTKAGRQFDI